MLSLGSIFVACYSSTEKVDHLRINGDYAKIEAYIKQYDSPNFRVVFHEPLRRVSGGWTVRLSVYRVAVPVEK